MGQNLKSLQSEHPQSIRLLFVDDEEEWQRIIKSNLEPRGFVVLTEESGKQAIEIVRNDKSKEIKAVLLDWLMPNQYLQGPGVLKHFLDIRPDLPVFALTGMPQKTAASKSELVKKAVEIRSTPGLKGYFVKDIEQGQLEEDYDDVARSIQESVLQIEIILERIPRQWKRQSGYVDEYMKLRNSTNWDGIEKEIADDAERGIEGYRTGRIQQTLGTAYPSKKDGHVDITTVLIARRIVIVTVWELKGNFFKSQVRFGYSIPTEATPRSCPKCRTEIEDYYATRCTKCNATFLEKKPPRKHLTFSDNAFKKYCSQTLGLSVQNIRLGRGLLPEEEEWFKKYQRVKIEI
jgi:CheY-like chemotaxis protein